MRLLTSEDSIKEWLESNGIKWSAYDITEHMSVDVDRSVELSNKQLTDIPVKFNKISGSFDVSNNELTNLNFAPKEVSGYVDISGNKLVSLEGLPKNIGGTLYLSLKDSVPSFDGVTINLKYGLRIKYPESLHKDVCKKISDYFIQKVSSLVLFY